MEWLTVYVIYDSPKDYPDKWVLRRQRVGPAVIRVDDDPMYVGDDLEQARSLLPPGLILSQVEDPEPSIYEVWI